MTSTLSDTATARRLRSESLSDSWLSARLGVDKGRIDALRRSGELIGVREAGGQAYLYPAWQFQDGRPRPVIAQIVRMAREQGIGEARLYEVLTMRMGLGGDRRLADLLVAGDDAAVLAGVRSATP